MEKVFRIIVIGLFVIVILIGLLLFWLKIASTRPMVKSSYWNSVQTGGTIEAAYTCPGEHAVCSVQIPVEDRRWSHVSIWYPEDMVRSGEKYPLIVMANGTGVQDARYEPVFEHAASWGFIVIGNDDPSSGLGDSSAESLDLMLTLTRDPSSIFYQKVDEERIGIAGHSQGGVAVIHALYRFDNASLYRAAYTASATTETMIRAWNLTDFTYDISKVTVPILMVAGTGKTDAETISPLSDMEANFAAASAPTIIARRKEADHGEMLYVPSGYMVAWFRFTLMGDANAAKAFVGDDAELLTNTQWQDVQRKGFDETQKAFSP